MTETNLVNSWSLVRWFGEQGKTELDQAGGFVSSKGRCMDGKPLDGLVRGVT